jgi:hypothetical protein
MNNLVPLVIELFYLRLVIRIAVVVLKNSIRLPSDRDVGTYLFGLRDLENPGSQLGWQKIPLSLTSIFLRALFRRGRFS